MAPGAVRTAFAPCWAFPGLRGTQKSRCLAKGTGFSGKRPLKKRQGVAVAARVYCAAGKPWIFIPGLMPFDENQPLLISNAYTPLFFGQ